MPAPLEELAEELLLLDDDVVDELLVDELAADDVDDELELVPSAPAVVPPPQPLSASPISNPKGLIVDLISWS